MSRGMIPKLDVLTYDGAARLVKRGASHWTVLYLRARKSGDRLKGFYRRNAMERKQAAYLRSALDKRLIKNPDVQAGRNTMKEGR